MNNLNHHKARVALALFRPVYPRLLSLILFLLLQLSLPVTASAADNLSINCPDEITLSCGQDISPQFTGLATGNSNCGGLVISFFDSSNSDCGNSVVITRTWTATDNCGGTLSCVQQITIDDNTPPTINYSQAAGSTVDVECNLADDNWSAFAEITASLQVNDDCGSDNIDLSLNHELITEGVCGETEYLSIWYCIWTATDPCGNSSTFDLNVRILDSRGPLWLSFPDDLDLECGEDVPLEYPTATDNCSNVNNISYTDQIIDENCPNSYTIRREWIALDGCGNTTKDFQYISMTDNEPPTIAFTDGFISNYEDGEVVFIDCIQYGRITQLDYAVHAFDHCSDEVDIEFEYDDYGYFDCAEFGYSGHVLTRWTATDQCGNSTTALINWLLVDETAPRLQNVPEDICVAGSLPPAPTVYGLDECDFVTVEMIESVPIECADGQYVERTWVATDACGNTASETQKVYFSDATPPNIRIEYPNLEGLPSGSIGFVPADCNIDNQIVTPDLLSAVQVSDGCSDVRVEKTLDLLSNGGCVTEGFLARYQLRVIASDLCGNESTYELFIHLIDATPPTIEAAAELLVNCGETIPAATAFDECGEVTDIFYLGSDDIPISCNTNPQYIDRFWLAIDACGNTNVFEQRLAIIDNTGPVFHNIPATACANDAIPTDIIAFDECVQMEVEMTMTESSTELIDCGEVLLRTWTATDSCGNQSTATQHVVLADEEAPSLSFAHPLLIGLQDGGLLEIPVGFTYGGPDAPLPFTPAAINAQDNCDSPLDILVNTSVLNNAGCESTGYLSQHEVEWLVSDACGNASSISIMLAYTDHEAPEILHVPGDMTLYCEDIFPDAAAVLARDNYDLDLETTFEETFTWTSYGHQILRIWTATDDCGNFTEEQQLIEVYDNDLATSFSYPNEVNCNTDNNEITINVQGGTSPYTYKWEMIDCDGFITSDVTIPSITYTLGYTTQNFSVTITDVNGCDKVDAISIFCVNDDVNTPPGGFFTTVPGTVPQAIAYPNPAHQSLMVQTEVFIDEPMDVHVYNILGQSVYFKRVQNWPSSGWKIDTRQLADGAYWVHLQPGQGEPITQEIIIQH